MQLNFENPFRPSAKRATKRLFKAGNKQKIEPTKGTKEKVTRKMEEVKVKYGPYNILYPQVQFLKEIEKLIPEGVLDKTGKTAKEILVERLEKVSNGNIFKLDLNNLKLTSLPELPPSLQEINCGFNRLTSLPELPPALQYLDCYENNLNSLPKLPPALQTLNCQLNQLTTLPKLPLALQRLHCNDNQLSELPMFPPALHELDCVRNQLTSLPELPPTLQKLYCQHNSLSIKTKDQIKSHKNYNPKNFQF